MAKEDENMELSFPEIFDILDCSMEDMLDVLSQAIDMLEEGKNEDALEVLKALEEDMFDFLGYVDEGEVRGMRMRRRRVRGRGKAEEGSQASRQATSKTGQGGSQSQHRNRQPRRPRVRSNRFYPNIFYFPIFLWTNRSRSDRSSNIGRLSFFFEK